MNRRTILSSIAAASTCLALAACGGSAAQQAGTGFYNMHKLAASYTSKFDAQGFGPTDDDVILNVTCKLTDQSTASCKGNRPRATIANGLPLRQ